jgi:hypothetical protein
MNENFGLVNQRLKPKLEVLRGWKPQSNDELRVAYPVAPGVTILSGQLVAPKWNSSENRFEWVLPSDSTAHAPQYYFADADGDQFDVIEANKLPALSCAGQYELETAYWTGAANGFTLGAKIAPDLLGTPGNVKVAEAGEVIIAECVRNNGPVSVLGRNSHVKTRILDGGNWIENPGLAVVTLRLLDGTTSVPVV